MIKLIKLRDLNVLGKEIKVYQYGDQKVFRMRDIHEWLDMTRTNVVKKMKYVDEDLKFDIRVDTPGGEQLSKFVNLSGLKIMMQDRYYSFYKQLLNEILKIV